MVAILCYFVCVTKVHILRCLFCKPVNVAYCLIEHKLLYALHFCFVSICVVITSCNKLEQTTFFSKNHKTTKYANHQKTKGATASNGYHFYNSSEFCAG